METLEVAEEYADSPNWVGREIHLTLKNGYEVRGIIEAGTPRTAVIIGAGLYFYAEAAKIELGP